MKHFNKIAWIAFCVACMASNISAVSMAYAADKLGWDGPGCPWDKCGIHNPR